LSQIKEIKSRGRVPILVGGTHYYTQALLFKDHIIEKDVPSDSRSFSILDEPTEVILAKLKEVDPQMADRWHPNDRRKIRRSLEIWLQTGKRASETYIERLTKQSNLVASINDSLTNEELNDGSSLRFPTLLFWVFVSRDALRARLDCRVLQMVRDGLLNEVATMDDFKASQMTAGYPVDQTRGIWVSIGYKEFEVYQTILKSGAESETELSKLKDLAIEQTQAATRQYAKRQIRWIRIKLLNALSRSRSSGATFLLDGSNVNQWDENVTQPATKLVEKYLEEKQLPNPLTLSTAALEMLQVNSEDMTQRPDLWVTQTCLACGVTAATSSNWKTHIKSRGHRMKTSARALKRSQEVTKKNPKLSPKESLEEPFAVCFDELAITKSSSSEDLGGSERR
jgi:tRNA dimethylallyltransferase